MEKNIWVGKEYTFVCYVDIRVADIDIMGLLLLPLPVPMVYYVDNTLFSTTKFS